MKDEILALELTKLYTTFNGTTLKKEVFDTYNFYLDEIKERNKDNKIEIQGD